MLQDDRDKKKGGEKMIRSIKKYFYSVLLCVLVAPSVSMAGYSSTAAKPTGVPTTASFSTIILGVVNWILGFIAILSVLMIVVSGVMYITSGGDSGTTGKAKDYLTYSIIGLVVAILSYTIVRLISILLGAS